MTQPNWSEQIELCLQAEAPREQINRLFQKSIQQSREEVVRDILRWQQSGFEGEPIVDVRHIENYAKEKGLSLTPNTEIL